MIGSTDDRARRAPRGAWWAAGAALLVLAAAPLGAQTVLEQFSYDSLRPAGLQVDLGVLASSRLRGALVGGVRFDAGDIAPRLRVLLGLSYFKAPFSRPELDRFAARLASLVNDPDTNFTIDVGSITWSSVVGDVDLQYAFPQASGVTTYLGVGAGIAWRHASGAAIDGTFVQDALGGLAPAFNVTVASEIRITPGLAWTAEGRGSVASGLSTISVRTGLMFRFGRGGRR